MGRSTATTPVPPDVIRTAVSAYDVGHRLVCEWINEALLDWRIELRLKAKPPVEGSSLGISRRVLSNALHAYRAVAPDLAPDHQLRPWIFALYTHDDGRQIGKGICLSEDVASAYMKHTEEEYWRGEIRNFVAVKHSVGWREKEFQQNVIEPITENSNDWIRWLRRKDVHTDGRVPVAETERVQLFEPDEAPYIDGVEQTPITSAQYEVVLALVKNAPRRLDKDTIEGIRDGARRALRDLAKSNRYWRKVLLFAQVKGGGYGIK